MYVLWAVLASIIVFMVLVLISGYRHQGPTHLARLALVSALVLGAALVAFNIASRAVGVDLGPGYAVSYDIPFDFLDRGAWGVLSLLPLAVACCSPALAWAILGRR